jgi:Family of unknown function (DUF5694)
MCMKKYKPLLVIFFLFISNGLLAQAIKQKEILLIGTFHFNNPGLDISQTDKFNVLSESAQKELQTMAEKIKRFAPDKIFVEWDFNNALKLDSLYDLYVNDKYHDFVAKNFPKNAFYKENEIFQLGFRAARLSGNNKVYGIDIKTEFPFDRVLLSVEKAKQTELKENIFKRTKQFEQRDNENRKKYSLTQLIVESNKQSNRNFDLGSYITLFNAAGENADFTGPDLVASWYRRNLLMYSFVQKLTEKSDDKIVILLGASHIALFKHFIDLDENYKVVELKDILRK